MSLMDDFLEAWRSVKRDFFRDADYTGQQPTPTQQDDFGAVPPRPERAEGADTRPPEPFYGPSAAHTADDEMVFKAFHQAGAIRDEEENNRAPEAESDDENGYGVDPTPYRHFDPDLGDRGESAIDRRFILDSFDTGGVVSDDRTIISRNTIIRGTLQTEDSVRLLGQVMGDIDCKSNIVVAGKVRGNTTAANAYIFDAQVDGDVRCDDIVNVGNDAWVLGNIRAQQAEIDGKIKGNVEIRHMVSIGSSSSVLGDISADELEIKRGAFINGQIMMYSPSKDVLDRFDRLEER